ERAALETEVAGLRSSEEAFGSAKAKLEVLQKELDAERKAWHLLEGQATTLKEQIAGLEADAKKLQESGRQREALRGELEIYDALRFAIARELASMPQIGRTFGRMKTLFIDEGDLGSLDTEISRELFVQKLLRMGEVFEKVILITHLAEIAERFPGRIRVTMTPSQESRAEVLS